MKLKKINISLIVISSVTPLSSVVSCYIGNNTTRYYLEKLKDYDWKTDYISNVKNNWELNDNGKSVNLNELGQENTKKINGLNGPIDNIFDYDKYTTSFKSDLSIQKQAVTGSPIIKSYTGNGNRWSDFGLESHSRKYNNINSILDWDDKDSQNNFKDIDLKYNTTVEDIKNRNYVAKNEVKSQQYVKNKNTGVYFNQYGSAISSNSSIVGSKNIFLPIDNNMEYIHNFITWPSIQNDGFITPSFADNTNELHKNGARSFGLIYFSGWEGLTRYDMRNLLKKDNNGDYLIADIMINLCLKLNFDGWFINDEANGSMPDGYALRSTEIRDILAQFKAKADFIYKTKHKLLQTIYYTNNSSVRINANGLWESKKIMDVMNFDSNNNWTTSNEFQLDFENQRPGDEDKYIKTYGDKYRKKLYSMYYTYIYTPCVGSYDYRNYIYKKNIHGEYTGNPATSFSTFGPGAQIKYGEEFTRMMANMKKITSNPALRAIMSQEVANYYNSFIYTGVNGYLDSTNSGNDNLNQESQQPLSELIEQDPRLSQDSFNRGAVTNEDYKIKNGRYNNSIGFASTFRPFTVITDSKIDDDGNETENTDNINLKTNFSTGSGIYFKDSNDDRRDYDKHIYPWSNIYMADISPTYKWDFWKTEAGRNTFEDKDTPDGTKYRSLITDNGQLNGYYDYYDPYLKGNSISIGNGYNFNDDSKSGNGRIKPGDWENGTYNWNIMGTNLSKNNYVAKFVVKSTSNDSTEKDNDSEINNIAKNSKIIVTTSKNNPIALTPKKDDIKDLGNGWNEISVDLSQINSISKDNRIAKLGVQISNNSDKKFIYSVGEFSIKDSNNSDNKPNKADIKNINNEYIVKRKFNHYNINIRYNWTVDNATNVDYYEIYFWYKNKWLLVKTTSNNADFLQNLEKDENNQIKIGVRAVFKDNSKGQLHYNTFNV